MKTSLAFLLLMFTLPALAQQTVTEKFQKINTPEDAQKFVDANAALKPEILHLTFGKDTSLIEKRLLRQKKGDVFSVGYVTYKVIDSKESVAYRASYIFLDGGSLNEKEIDSMKKLIVQKLNAGADWKQLSNQYTMDGNKTFGDTGWFFGPEMLPAEFQDAVAKHKTGEVFFVDVPDKQWHYIVKKTYDDDLKKEMTVLKANGR
ncbi:MAG TPA: peptidylprolyl isomerase [Chitinophagaceae bacterium]|nr:peptidylprolyl isomerase [Chitinophagaceae bacterium]